MFDRSWKHVGPPVLMIIIVVVISVQCTVRNTSGAQTKSTEMEIPSNFYRSVKLEDYDSKGDNLHLTVIYQKREDISSTPRRVNYYIVEKYIADNFDVYTYDVLLQKSQDMELNVTGRVDKDVVNTKDTQLYLVIDNPYMEGDDKDPKNETAYLRVDYIVTEEEKEAGLEFMGSELKTGVVIFFILALISVIAIITFTAYSIISMKKKERAIHPFFASVASGYYVFSGPDGSTYYFSRSQYEDMYKAGSLVGYEYLGESGRIGGDIEFHREELPPQTETYVQPDQMEATPVNINLTD
jgi:hypothetical protein